MKFLVMRRLERNSNWEISFVGWFVGWMKEKNQTILLLLMVTSRRLGLLRQIEIRNWGWFLLHHAILKKLLTTISFGEKENPPQTLPSEARKKNIPLQSKSRLIALNFTKLLVSPTLSNPINVFCKTISLLNHWIKKSLENWTNVIAWISLKSFLFLHVAEPVACR